MPEWVEIVDRIVRAEQDVATAKELLKRAEQDEASARADLAKVMKGNATRAQQIIAGALNGGRHTPSHAPPPEVRSRVKHDYTRRLRVLELMRASGGVITNLEVAHKEGVPSATAAGVLARMARMGEIHRVRNGRYALGPMFSESASTSPKPGKAHA